MKINFVCFKFSKVFLLTSCIILILIAFLFIQIKPSNEEKNNQLTSIIEENYKKTDNNSSVSNTLYTPMNEIKVQEKKKSRKLPKKLKGFEIIGKIKIPKLNIEKYILNENTAKALKVSVTKLCGPDINEIGNFCIAGHNYKSIFAKINKLEINDKIILTDIYGDNITYNVYDKFECSPKDVSCLDQNTNSEKELTLITCKFGAIKRIIIKAVEVYD